MKDGILRLQNNRDDGVPTTFRAIVPKRARQRILKLAHSSAGKENFGIQETVNKPKKRVHRNRMTRYVCDWCDKFPSCNRHKTQQQNRASMQQIYTNKPFERMVIDIIGLLPKANRGNLYILKVVYHITKHVKAFGLADQEGTTVTLVFFNEFLLWN